MPWHYAAMKTNIPSTPFKDTSAPASLATIESFRVQNETELVLPGPIPRNIGVAVVHATKEGEKWNAIRALRPLMRPWAWLDMVLRLQQGLKASPMPIREELIASFKHYRYYLSLSPKAQSWWTSSEAFRIYRGAYANVNERGMCWSVDPQVAAGYVREGGCGDASPVLIAGAIQGQHCIAHQLHREEVQVLVDPEKVTFLARYVLPLEDEEVSKWYLPKAL